MLAKIRDLTKVVLFFQTYSNGGSGHAIAIQLEKRWSRATTYRLLSRARKMGLLNRNTSDYGYVWTVTEYGHSFLGAWNEIQF